jgi:hypothetical protein
MNIQPPYRNRNPALIKHDLLHPDELPIPGKGTLVSIDAEFVLMQQVGLEYLSYSRVDFTLVYTGRDGV